jgi:anthranilate synthase component 1
MKRTARNPYNVVRIALDFSSDTLTPVLAFLRLARAGQKSFLLESVEGGERIGRYSFLGINPRETLRIRNGVALLERDGSSSTLEGNPFQAIGKYLSRYRAEKRPGLPPLQGGAIGFLSYECASFLERIPVPKATSVDRDRDQACMMVFRDIVAFDHVRRRVFVLCNVFTDEEGQKNGTRDARRRAEKIRSALFEKSPHEKPVQFEGLKSDAALAPVRPAMGKGQYVKAVQKVKEHIRAGDIFQCVLSDQFTFDVKAEPFTVYRALQTVNPSPYLFYLSFGKDVLLGASPEMLIRSVDGKVETCPIAGTRPRGADHSDDKKNERDLLKSVKERAEHLMLVDLGRNDIGRVSKPGSVRVKDFMHIERFSHVMHLVSIVEGKLGAKRTPWDALASCFPAGTLSGAPKIRAMEIIASLEPVRRNAYGGAVVYYDFAGHLDSCITIRSLFVRERQGFAQAGAGIVADSRPDSEYNEVLHKLKAIRRAVAMANGARI